MKVCLIQPEYSTDYGRSDELFQKELEYLRACDETMDIIVMPELSDCPALAKTKEQSEKSSSKYKDILLDEAAKTAKRCNAMVFINARSEGEKGLRNTTYAFDRNGEIVGKYYKQHLVQSEVSVLKLDSDYSFEFSEPTVIEIEGIRFGFLICYDFYFYEAFANIARQKVDVIIGCSHQRSDTHSALQIMSQFLAYNTNAYVLRSSVSMDVNSNIGGASMVVAPNGDILCNMESRIGMETVDIDISKKYYKPAGYGNPLAAHYEYIEKGRRPWKYRPAGSAIVKPDAIMPYPRICAHRGFNTIAPENSLPAFGAAVALGAEEIEFDLWKTADGHIVSIHDPTLERVSNGEGFVYEKTYDELLKLDFGEKHGEHFKGLEILTFEKILQKFSCHTVMNIHIKSKNNTDPLPEKYLQKIVALIDKYDCRQYVYFVTGNDTVLEQLQNIAPDICRCCGGGDAPFEIVERAIKYGCKKVQLFKPHFNREMIDKAHDNGIICNVFWSDDAKEAKEFLDMGIDTILTNDYHSVAQCIKKR